MAVLDRARAPARSDAGAERIPILDLFAGAGGLSLGLRRAGFEPVAAVEVMPEAARTYEATHNIGVIDRPIETLADADLRAFRGEVRVVVGGPPCQPWSTGGLRRGRADERDGFPEFLRALQVIQPEAFLIENVAGLDAGQARLFFRALVERLRELGYHVWSETLDAADFGVPQRRRRMFIVGMRVGSFAFPRATHGPGRRHEWVPAGAVLTADPMGEPNTSIVTYAKNPQLRPSPYDGLLVNGGGRPVNLSAPARTVLASAGGNKTAWIDVLGVIPEYHAALLSHYRAHGTAGLSKKVRKGRVPGARRITVAESAALQTFPREMEFHGRRSTQYTLVGNAVPPDLAAAVGRSLRRALRAVAQ